MANLHILEGKLPEEPAWRALVLLAPGEELGLSWQLARGLADANHGEAGAIIVLWNPGEHVLEEARETLQRARQTAGPNESIFTLLIEARERAKTLEAVVEAAHIDLLVARADSPVWEKLDPISCALAVVRGEAYSTVAAGDGDGAADEPALPKRILVPTSGGPNTAHALSLLLPLAGKGVEVTALYVAPEQLGANEEALGRDRLRQTLAFVDGVDRVEGQVVVAPSVAEGIVTEAHKAYDLVIIGATQESSLDHVLFGNIPAAVVRESKKPVVVVRGPGGRVGNLLRDVEWMLSRVLPRLGRAERTEAYVRIRRGARPDIDYYVLISLSAAIAALGLIADSTAVVIGAMLVAPLMLPLAGIGLAIVLGDTRFLRLTLGAVLRGAGLALVVSIVFGLLDRNGPLTNEVLARTQPIIVDLGVALFSGMAVAYALSRSDANAALPGVAIAAALVPPLASSGIALAKGEFEAGLAALLLFITNLIAIASASALVFLLFGFRPTRSSKERQRTQRRTAQIALSLLLAIAVVLGLATFRLAREASLQARIQSVTRDGVAEITGGTVVDTQIERLSADPLQLDVTIRATRAVPHGSVLELQEYLVEALGREVALTLTVIPTTRLDPLAPPTPTAEPVAAG